MRAATNEDVDDIVRVFAAVAEEGLLAAEPPIDRAERAARFREAIEGAGPGALWVLEDDGEIVGHGAVHESHAPGVLALGMAIEGPARGRGGGRSLLDALIEQARRAGAHKLELEVWPENARAIALYASAGFVVEGVRHDHYRRRDGSLRSALLMARAL